MERQRGKERKLEGRGKNSSRKRSFQFLSLLFSLSGSHIPLPGPLYSLSWSIGSNLRLGGLRFGGKSLGGCPKFCATQLPAAPNSCVCSRAQIFPKNKCWSHLPPYSPGVVGIGQFSAVALKTCDSCPRICQQPIVQPSQFWRFF